MPLKERSGELLREFININYKLINSQTDNPEPNEYVISKSDDSALFALITDMIDIKNPVRNRLLAYYKKLKTDSDQ